MRTLFVVPEPVHGGAVLSTKMLVERGVAGGIEPLVATLRPGPMVEQFRDTGATMLTLDVGRLRQPRLVVGSARALKRFADQQSCEVIVATEPKAQLYTWAAGWGRLSVWCQHGHPNPRGPIDLAAAALPSDGVITPSEHVARLQRRLPSRTQVLVSCPGIDIESFRAVDGDRLRKAHGIKSDAPLIGIIGRLQQWKGQDLFLRAAADIAAEFPSVRFAVVGGAELGWERGDYPGELRVLAAHLGLSDRVIFTGQVSDPREWTAALDISVNASTAEPFGLVIVEAMALGTPVVAMASGGPSEIIADGETGVLVHERSSDALALAIAGLLRDPDRASRIGAAASFAVEERFSDVASAARFGAILRRLASERSP